MRGRSSVVAVIDATDDGVVVWWVNVGLPNGMSRLCGAWVVEPMNAVTLETLTFDRVVWPTAAGSKALVDAGVQAARLLDADATVAEAEAALVRYQSTFDEDQASRGNSKRITVPRWPEFLAASDLDAKKPRGEAKHASVEKALTSAQWLANLCVLWEELETARLSRPVLRRLDGPIARPLPVVTK